MSKSQLEDGLLQLAKATLDEMNRAGANTPLEDRLETIKIISALHFGVEKLSAKVPNDEPFGRSMKDWKREIIQGEAD